MKKNIKVLLILFIGLLFITGCKYTVEEEKGEVLYKTTYYFGLGSRRVLIYDNGHVYDDVEIEDPRHEVNYVYLKSLSKKELKSLKKKIDSSIDNEDINSFVIQLVYGVDKFENNGGY